MPIYDYRRRVACYLTRTTEHAEELLVFERHPDHAPADPPTGTQIPVGEMLPFEAIDVAAFRQVQEQTGVETVTYVEQVGFVELGLDAPGGPSMTTYVHLQASSDGCSAWEHAVTGEGKDAGMTLMCRWEPLPLSFDLAHGHGQFLDAVLS